MNPYLAAALPVPASGGGGGGGGGSGAPSHASSRLHKARRAFNFVEPGAISAQAEQERAREARRLPVGGFRRPLHVRQEPAAAGEGAAGGAAAGGAAASSAPPAPASAASAPASAAPAAAAPAAAAAAAAAAPPAPPAPSSSAFLPPLPSACDLATALAPRHRYTGAAAVAIEWWDAPFLPPARAKHYAARHGSGEGRRRPAYPHPGAAPAGAGAAAAQPPPATLADDPPPFSYAECATAHVKTLALVAHPVPLTAGGEPFSAAPPPPPPLPLLLTASERARLRRRSREERHRATADQVRMGLLPPPPPKVRLANLMRVLKDSAVADPSALEAQVRAATAARTALHAARGASAKLTPAERRAKAAAKLGAHGREGPAAALFYARALTAGRARYKVDVNARQLGLVGLALCAGEGERGAGGGEGEEGGLALV